VEKPCLNNKFTSDNLYHLNYKIMTVKYYCFCDSFTTFSISAMTCSTVSKRHVSLYHNVFDINLPYTSSNTHQLSVTETIDLIVKLPEFIKYTEKIKL
jgi:hypothetical protein